MSETVVELLLGVAIGAAFVFAVKLLLSAFRDFGVDLPKMCRQIEQIQNKLESLDKRLAQSVNHHLPGISAKVDDLHAWHSKEDEMGVKLWYVPRDLVDVTRILAREVHEIKTALTRLEAELKAVKHAIERDYRGPKKA